ncbi:hypothetical protein FT230_23225 [Escherichia coli]|nr:hypothetical protein [Escherichia coli]
MQCCPVCRAHLRLPAAWRHPVVRPDSDRQLLAHPPVSAEPAGAVSGCRYPDQFLPLQRDMIGKFGAAKDQWFSSFLLQVENHSSWHRLFVDPLSRAMYSSDGPDFEFVQQKRKEGLSIHEAVWQLAWKKSGPEMASLEAWLEEHEKYRSVA